MKRTNLNLRQYTRLRDGRWWRIAVFAAGVFPVVAEAAWAQQKARLPDEEGTLIRYGVLAGVVVVIAMSAFLNPKRTHHS